MDTLAGAHSDRARTHNQSLPVEVFMKGENISGFNPAGDTRSYYCFRIPQLLALPSGRLLAFAEGRADGCRPDVHVNRPIVVRASSDQGDLGPHRDRWSCAASSGHQLPWRIPAGQHNDRTALQHFQWNGLRDVVE